MRRWMLFLVLVTASLPAYASFDQQVVAADYLYPDAMSTLPDQIRPDETCVGPGIEFFSGLGGAIPPNPPPPEDQIAIDLAGGNILFSNVLGGPVTFSGSGATFNGFQLRDVDGTIPDITGVAINGATNVAIFSPADLFFDANSIRINLQDGPWQPSEVVSLDVTFAGPPPPAAAACVAPVPSLPTPGLAFLAVALGLIGLFALRPRLAGRSS